MGFKSVYRALQEVFPQFDNRLLRAVAIEHSKDADAAVEAVLTEVVPYLSEQSTSPHSNKNKVSEVAMKDAQRTPLANDAFVDSTCLDVAVNKSSRYDASDEPDQMCGGNENEKLISLRKSTENSVKVGPDLSSHVSLVTSLHDNNANINLGQVCGNIDSEKTFSVGTYQESSYNIWSDQSSPASTPSEEGVCCTSRGMNYNLNAELEDIDAISGGNQVEDSVVQLAPSPVEELMSSAPDSSLQFVVASEEAIMGCRTTETVVSSGTVSERESSVNEKADLDDDSNLNSVDIGSGQICTINLLEEIIAEARSNKKTLFSYIDAVLRLMREVELQVEAAEQAKQEAARGGLDIHSRVVDLQEKLSHAKEANELHAGEVYGEKAILATEVKELQSRLLSLSVERDQSYEILEEMRQTLEGRLAAAEKEKETAIQEKLRKEELAQNALAEQELLMEKVVEESKMLKQEAKENSKLLKYLVDRGRAVDTLQGEISVICQDVKLLKEKFDEQVRLSKSLSSRQTSCIIASSSLSPKSVSEEADPSEASKDSKTFTDDQLISPEEESRDDQKSLVDDGWDLLDKREFGM